jgi:CO/xanthine dehydrogenase Mo-binding subunit
MITGSRGDRNVTINVRTQADGKVQVEFSAKAQGVRPRIGRPNIPRVTGASAVKIVVGRVGVARVTTVICVP